MDSTSEFSYMKTFGGYAILLGIGFAFWYNYGNKNKQRLVQKQPGRQVGDTSADTSLAAVAKKKAEKALKPKPKPKPTPAVAEPSYSSGNDYNPTAEAASSRDTDRDFAALYSKAKTGHSFTAAKKEDKRQRSIKQSRAQEAEAPAAKTSAPSSTTGDADDDLSPAVSPVVGANNSRDVSDMLEPVAAGPSILRLTDTDKVKQKESRAKPVETAETKKQRQNRKKVEQKKLEREQDEAERKKLEEAQRRRARIAEGRPAKDGSTFTANKENAWSKKTNGESFIPVQPLDTFDPTEVTSTTPKATPATKSESASWQSSAMSEEEQMKAALADAPWNEVTTKKGKKGKKASESVAETSAPAAKLESLAPVTSATPAAKSSVNGTNKATKPALSSNSSFAALTPEETADEDEVEWDV